MCFRFKKFAILQSDDKSRFQYPDIPLDVCQLEDMADFFRATLKKPFTRGDYKELVELSLLLVTKVAEPRGFTMKRPGALHKARWMSKLLYAMKMTLLSEEIS